MSKITDILDKVVMDSHNHTVKGDSSDFVLRDIAEAEQAITDLINEAIGNDERANPFSYTVESSHDPLIRNELRQDIRTKLGLTTKEDK